jgi:hypothetical protein
MQLQPCVCVCLFRLKTAALQYESSQQQSEAVTAHLQSELRDKERELSKSQELVRTLAAATRAATNELDSQLHYSQTARRGTPAVGSASGAPVPAFSYGQPSPARPFSAYSNSLTNVTSAAAAPTPTPALASGLQGGSSVRLRHHPGGRLSMDLSGRPVAEEQTGGLRFDDDGPMAQISASAPGSISMQRSQPLHTGASDAPASVRSEAMLPASRE